MIWVVGVSDDNDSTVLLFEEGLESGQLTVPAQTKAQMPNSISLPSIAGKNQLHIYEQSSMEPITGSMQKSGQPTPITNKKFQICPVAEQKVRLSAILHRRHSKKQIDLFQ